MEERYQGLSLVFAHSDIEFRDDIHREGGEFLTKVLNELNIDKCEKDI